MWLRIHFYRVISQRTETLMSEILHVSADIHVFHLASCTVGFGTAWQSSVKIRSSLFGVSGVPNGSLVRHLSYW